MEKKVNDALRAKYVATLMEYFGKAGEEVLRTGTGELALPVVDESGEDNWVVFTVKVPTGSRDGEPYDGYGEAESFTMKEKEKAEKAKERAEAKARKMAKDKAEREAKAKAKAEHAKAKAE